MSNPLSDCLEIDPEAFTLALLQEVEYLRYFYETADFGPAHGDVMYAINEDYPGTIPEGYQDEE